MDAFMNLPALVQVLAVFASVVLLNAWGLHMGLAALFGAAAIGLWGGIAPLGLLSLVASSLASPDTVLLATLIGGIMVLSSFMRESGSLDSLVTSYRALVRSPRFATASIPTVIGVLPVPGGALFSAPMVSAIDRDNELDDGKRAAINYWYRHIIELLWPLYPAFVLTMTISRLPLLSLMAVNFYAPIVLALGGAFFLLPRSYGRSTEPRSVDGAAALWSFLGAFAPVVIVVLSALLLGPLFKAMSWIPVAWNKNLPAIFGVGAAIAYTLAKVRGMDVRKAFPRKGLESVIGTIVGIKAFSAATEAAGLAQAVSSELGGLGIPAAAVLALLPFIAGLVTGVGFGYVGLSFPIVLGMVPPDAGLVVRAASVALAGAWGFSGMMLSPLHVCMAVSSEHFRIRNASLVRAILPPVALFLGAATLYYWILTRL